MKYRALIPVTLNFTARVNAKGKLSKNIYIWLQTSLIAPNSRISCRIQKKMASLGICVSLQILF